MNLYFFRFAKMMAVKEERREGHSYIEPSWIASHIYQRQSRVFVWFRVWRTVWAHLSSMAVRSRFL